MKTAPIFSIAFLVLAGLTVCISSCEGPMARANSSAVPEGMRREAFRDHRDSVPSVAVYNAPLFKLSHDYPSVIPRRQSLPWCAALRGRSISDANAFAYIGALKRYVEPALMPFFTDTKSWTASRNGWFHEPWLGSEREAILGTYQGNGNPAHLFKSLTEDESGYVLTLYDSVAAYTLGQVWGNTGGKVNLVEDAAQFREGSVIVKLAFSNINYPAWPVMEGAQTFFIYDTIPTAEQPQKGYQLRKVSFFQMDIIVKDSQTAPATGWVYSTFVYDKDAQGSAWDKMVPLGAMWGNDPEVLSPLQPPFPPLKETVINPDAPAYSKETLGWGGRLSGPNDGAVVPVAYDVKTRKRYTNLAVSSCLSCHSTAQDAFESFLLPGPFPTSDSLLVYTPGSLEWNLWFRNSSGNGPFNGGQVSLDYDMVTAFKSIPAWQAAKPSQEPALAANIAAVQQFRRQGSRARFWH